MPPTPPKPPQDGSREREKRERSVRETLPIRPDGKQEKQEAETARPKRQIEAETVPVARPALAPQFTPTGLGPQPVPTFAEPQSLALSRRNKTIDPLDLGLDEEDGPISRRQPEGGWPRPSRGFSQEEHDRITHVPTFSNPPHNDALDLIGHTAPNKPSSISPPPLENDALADLRERYALGDYSGALTIAEAILETYPNDPDALRHAESCREVLEQMYAARLGLMTQVPYVAVPLEQLRWLSLDHRAGFLLSHVDGISTLDEILDVSGMPRLEAMRTLYDLMQQKVIILQ
jgi:hypothetical protein